jgi:hypothetical protein
MKILQDKILQESCSVLNPAEFLQNFTLQESSRNPAGF